MKALTETEIMEAVRRGQSLSSCGNRHWEGSFTEGNGTEPLLTMGDAVNKYGYPSPCAYQMEQRVDLVDFQLGLQFYSFLVCQTVKHSSGIHTTGWRTDIIVGQLT